MSVHQVVNFACQAIHEQFGISVPPEEPIRRCKSAFCTDFLFTENPIVMAVYFVWEAARNLLLWDHFLKALDVPELGETLAPRIHDFEALWLNFQWPSDDQMTEEVKSFFRLNQILERLKSGQVRPASPLRNQSGAPVAHRDQAGQDQPVTQ